MKKSKVNRAASKSPLKQKPKTAKGGKLVFAVIADYRGLGKQQLILHEATIEPSGAFSYGNGKHWVFPAR